MIPPRPRQAIRGQPHRPRWTGLARLSPTRALRLLGRRIGGLRLVLWVAAMESRRRLQHQIGAPAPTRGAGATGGVVVVATYRGGSALLPGFLDHHRRLGVNEFVLLDLSPHGDLADLLAQQAGCAVWRPRCPCDDEDSLNMLNYLRHRYARRRWCLSLETTDLFVFHRCETRRLQSLLDFVASEHRDHVYALVIDMYAEEPAAGLAVAADAPALQVLPYFDPFGYVTSEPAADRGVTVRGGLHRRAQYAAMPWDSPALDRVPLVRWRSAYGYVESTRRLHPSRLNTPHAPWHSSPTACLLRLALLDGATEEPVEAAPRPAAARLARMKLHTEFSRRYLNTADLADSGLLNPGQWF